jgi:hypothetical protein
MLRGVTRSRWQWMTYSREVFACILLRCWEYRDAVALIATCKPARKAAVAFKNVEAHIAHLKRELELELLIDMSSAVSYSPHHIQKALRSPRVWALLVLGSADSSFSIPKRVEQVPSEKRTPRFYQILCIKFPSLLKMGKGFVPSRFITEEFLFQVISRSSVTFTLDTSVSSDIVSERLLLVMARRGAIKITDLREHLHSRAVIEAAIDNDRDEVFSTPALWMHDERYEHCRTYLAEAFLAHGEQYNMRTRQSSPLFLVEDVLVWASAMSHHGERFSKRAARFRQNTINKTPLIQGRGGRTQREHGWKQINEL